jgi:hypothetical protein
LIIYAKSHTDSRGKDDYNMDLLKERKWSGKRKTCAQATDNSSCR